jgi:HSP20 family protein
MTQLRNEVDRVMGDFFGGVSAALPRTYSALQAFPAVNVWEADDELFAEAELPGLKSEDLDVTVVGNELTLRGKRSAEQTEGSQFHRRERGVGEFSRTLRLPYDVDPAAVEATLRDGVLLLKLPKAASARPRKIQVNGAG